MDNNLTLSPIKEPRLMECPRCKGVLKIVDSKTFEIRDWEFIDADWLQPLRKYYPDPHKALRNIDASFGIDKCLSCLKKLYVVDVYSTAEDQSTDWWNDFAGGEKEELGNTIVTNYLESLRLIPREWVMYSEMFEGVRVDTHLFGPYVNIDEDIFTESLMSIKEELRTIASTKR